MRFFEPGDVILEAGHMPKDLLLLTSGTIIVVKKRNDAKPPHPNVFKALVEPGPKKIASLVAKHYGEIFMEKVINPEAEKFEVLGDECDLNAVASPYTYIAKDKVVALGSAVVPLYRDILRQNPEQMLKLRSDAQQKMKKFQTMVQDQKESSKIAQNQIESQFSIEKRQNLDSLISKMYPTGDQNVSSNITKII